MENKNIIIFTINKIQVEIMAYGGHICEQVSLHSVDPRISWAHSSSQKQHFMRYTSRGRVPAR